MRLGYTRFMTPALPNYATKGITLLKDARITAISLVDRGANNHEFFLFKRAANYVDVEGELVDRDPEMPEVEKYSPLLKMAEPAGGWKVAYCVVAVPGEIDQQKDVWDEAGIKDAAHDFMKGSPIINYMHQDLSKIGSLVESAIAPVDVEVDGYVIKKGSWYVGIEPFEEIKAEIDAGKIRGVSVQGTSKREDVDPADLSKYVDTNALHKNYALPGLMPEAQEEAPAPAVATDVPQAYRNDETIHIPLGASGPGIKILQRIVGLSQTGVYDQTTEAEFINYLSEHGLDPEPTLEILQSILRQLAQRGHEEAAAEAAASAQAQVVEETEEASVETPAAPVEGDVAPEAKDEQAEPVAKDSDGPFNPAGQPNTPPQVATASVGAQQINPDSSEQDLKQVLAQSVQTGNQLLAQHLSDVHGVSAPEEILVHEFDPQMLQFMVNVFVLGKMPKPSAQPQGGGASMAQAGYTPAELMPAGAGVPMHKGVWSGSHGGHDPEAKGKIKYIVRSFGQWANGKQSVAARKLLENGVVKTPEAADRLAAWLKDQWMGSTKWRTGNKQIAKRFGELLPELKKQNLGLSAAAVETMLAKMGEEAAAEDLVSSFASVHSDLTDTFQFVAEANSENYREVLGEIRGTDSETYDGILAKRFGPVEKLDLVSKSAETMTADEYTKHFDSAMRAVTLGLVDALSVEDANERLNDVSHVMADFDRWARDFAANSVPEVDNNEEAEMAAPNEDSVGSNAGAEAAPVEKSATLDRARLARLVETVGILNQAIEEAAPEVTEDDSDPTSTEPEAHVEEHEEAPVDPDYGYEGDDEAVETAEGDEGDESTDDATELEKEDENNQEEVMSADSGSNLNDVIHFCNDLADSLEEVVGRLGEFDGIGSKIEKVGELAKNLDVSDRIAALEDQVKQLTEAVAPAKEAAEASAEATQEVAKRLEAIENQPGERTSVLAEQEVIAKSAAPAPALFTRGGRSLF